ncbi:hypothetical protein [Mumia sp. DW29H23]|uniref:hypothetical protein n=1 Tax=Mumia sp. DW29H23 TaxID=3421241 RepID=UPI003D685742
MFKIPAAQLRALAFALTWAALSTALWIAGVARESTVAWAAFLTLDLPAYCVITLSQVALWVGIGTVEGVVGPLPLVPPLGFVGTAVVPITFAQGLMMAGVCALVHGRADPPRGTG